MGQEIVEKYARVDKYNMLLGIVWLKQNCKSVS